MQMYPNEGGYKEQYFAAAEAEHLIKGEHTNYGGAGMHGMMKPGHGSGEHLIKGEHTNYSSSGGGHGMMKPGHGYGGQSGHFKLGYQMEHGYGGHNGEYKHGHDHGYGGHGGQFKHNYDHGYGGGHNGLFKHDGSKHHGYGGHGHGGESYREEQSESFYEKERRASMMRNDYSGSGYGGQYHHQMGGMKHNAYGGHQGHYGPHKEQHSWSFKGIDD